MISTPPWAMLLGLGALQGRACHLQLHPEHS